jgi:Amt family ammonium transporter
MANRTSIPLVALGTGLLWFGWYGFNAGSELQVDEITALAFINTDISASFAAMTWLGIAWMIERKPKFVGLLTGAVAGLATITPAAAFVSPASAAIIGIAAGAVCYMAVSLKNRCSGTTRWTSGACTASAAHWASSCSACSARRSTRTAPTASSSAKRRRVLLQADRRDRGLQSIYAFGFTYGMLWLINKVTPVRTTEAEESGLDEALHGESAYESNDVI